MFEQQDKIILASNSFGRKSVLDFACLEYELAASIIDDEQEDLFKQTVKCVDVYKQIQEISNFKGVCVSNNYQDKYILSGDQACLLEGNIISKPKNKAQAVGQLLIQSGKTIELVTSITLSKNGNVVWEYQEIPKITLRNFSMKDVEQYFDKEEASTTGSIIGVAGACKIESPYGLHMIKYVNGSHYSIIGMPINALIDKLYDLDFII